MEKRNLPAVREEEMLSLNDYLYDDFFVQELESRLETDPLSMGGLVQFLGDSGEITPYCVSDAGESCSNQCGIDIGCIIECTGIFKWKNGI